MKHVMIIAEAGVNHNGSPELARRMIEVAKESGADYVKFQTFRPAKLVSRSAQKADYQKQTTGADETQLQMLEKLCLSDDDFRDLAKYANEIGIGFCSTPFDLESIQFLSTLGMDFWKVPSGEITNLPYLEAIGQTHKPVILSTGMCYLKEIEEAVAVLEKNGAGEITLLHCNTQYPTPMRDVNLFAMKTIAEATGKPVGYSDHTLGIEIPIGAVALGAEVIEKHFTLDKSMEGPDHRASLEPGELAEMIRAIRNLELALGDGEKKPSSSEEGNRSVARKSIVAAQAIRKGEVFSVQNITTKRPGNGISPMNWYEIIGRVASRDYEEDELIDE